MYQSWMTVLIYVGQKSHAAIGNGVADQYSHALKRLNKFMSFGALLSRSTSGFKLPYMYRYNMH